MADKTIEFETGLDIKPLQKDLQEIEKAIKKSQENIEKLRAKYDAANEKSHEAQVKADAEKEAAKAEIMNKYAGLPENSEFRKMRMQEIEDAAANIDKKYNVDKYMTAAEEAQKKLNAALQEQNTLEQRRAAKQAEITEQLHEQEATQKRVSVVTKSVNNILDMMKKRLKQMLKNVFLFTVISKLLYALKNAFTSVLKDNEAMTTAVGQLKQAFMDLITPIANALAPVLVTVLNFITRIIQALSMLFGKLFPKATKQTKSLGKAAGGAGSQLAGFDTIMKLGSSGGGGSGDEAQTYAHAQLTNAELGKTLALIGIIGAALLAWKVPTAISGFIPNMMLWLTTIAGVALEIYNFFKMWQDGIDLSELAGVLGGMLITAMALYKLLSPTAAWISVLVTGIGLLITGFHDAMENGSNLANTLTIIGGIIATGLGIAMLTGNMKILITTGVLALLYAIIQLAGQGEQFINGLKQAFNGLKTFITGVFTGDIESAMAGLKEFVSGIWQSLVAVIKSVINGLIWLLNVGINRINSIINQFNSGGLATLVRNITGWGVIPNIPSIPYLAQGAVIPPNREFMAVLGDQKSGVNIETPLDTMIEAFKAAQGDQSINVTFNGDLAGLAAILAPQITLYNKRRGL